MKFSIITICYNEKDIEQTCESIINQSHKDIEWIVMDGGSEQETLDILNKYKDDISVFISEKDNGVYNAMNKGLDYVTGDYVIFLNGGDYFCDNNVLQNVSSRIEKSKFLDFYYGDVKEISIDKKSSEIKKHNHLNLKNAQQFYYHNINHQVIFYKKSLLDKVGKYNEDFKIFADWDLNIRCFYKRNTKYKYLPIVVSCYQLGGLSSKNADLRTEEKRIIDGMYYKNIVFHKVHSFLYKYFRTPYKFFWNLRYK